MDFLKKLAVQTQSHLSGLTASQRLAIGSSALLIIVAAVWLSDWAQEPMYVALLDQPMKAEEITAIQQRLDVEGVKYKAVGDTIMVPVSDRIRMIGKLGQAGALPNDISGGLLKMLEESSPWDSQGKQDLRFNVHLGKYLSQMVAEFDGIESANVIVSNMTKRGFGQSAVQPTATVKVKSTPDADMNDERAHTICRMVAASVAGLSATNVTLTDSRNYFEYSPRKNQSTSGSEDLKVRIQKEAHFENKILDLYDIPNLKVAVTAVLDPEARRVDAQIYGNPQVTSETIESNISKQTTAGNEPGLDANTSVSVATSTPMRESTQKLTNTEFQAGVDATHTLAEIMPYQIKALSATVNVPRSYLAAIYAKANDGKEPTDDDLYLPGSGTQRELEKMRKSIVAQLALTPSETSSVAPTVVVDWYHDNMALVMMPGMAETATAGGGMMGMVKMYGSEAGLGALAVMSLFMMMLMVRKVGEGPILPGEEAPKTGIWRSSSSSSGGRPEQHLEQLDADAMPIGEAGLGEDLLEGQEVDDQTVRMQQVVEQVAEMVREDPGTSVQILQRWIDAEES